jgi:predicted nucleic acid-binding protein
MWCVRRRNYDDISMKYLVDTNIINWLVDRNIDGTLLPSDGEFFVTHIQIDEINKTSDEERRARLFLTLASSLSGVIPTETTIIGRSRIGRSKLGNGEVYTSIKSKLDAINGGRRSNINDALIAEVSIVNSHTLLTADIDLASVTEEQGGAVKLFTRK